jgi:hypothetical protein
MDATWQSEVILELQAARKAARDNLAGRSRVSARRAAGRAVKEYFSQLGKKQNTSNFYDLLVEFAREPVIPDDIRTIAEHLVQRVDKDHRLPMHVDLAVEAEYLFQYIRDFIDHRKAEG